MKASFKVNGVGQVVVITYSDDELKRLKGLFNKLKMEVFTSLNYFNSGKKGKCYKGPGELDKFLHNSLIHNRAGHDDVNLPVFYEGKLNLAIFRAVPDDKGMVEFPLQRFLDVGEANSITSQIAELYGRIFNIAEGDVEITVTKKKIEEKKDMPDMPDVPVKPDMKVDKASKEVSKK